MDKNKIEVKQVMAYEDALGYLEALVKSFREGRIVVRKGEEFVTLTPTETVEIEVSAKQKKEKGKFSLELTWLNIEEDGEPLVISDQEPVFTEVEKENADKCCVTVDATPTAQGAPVQEKAAAAKPVTDKPAPEKAQAAQDAEADKKAPAKAAAKPGTGK